MTAPLKTVEADTAAVMPEIGQRARKAARVLALAPTAQKDKALAAIAGAIRARKADILAANAEDMAEAKRDGANAAFLDRLALDDKRVAAMAAGVEVVRDLADPGRRGHRELDAPERHDDRARARAARRRRHHLREPAERDRRRRRALPQGRQCRDPARRLRKPALQPRHPRCDRRTASPEAGLPADAIQLVPTRDRAAVGMMLAGLDGAIDVIVPRGGKSLVARVQQEARVPVFAHLEGICHVYVDKAASLDMAKSILLNAKMRRTGVCGAAETLLVDRAVAPTHLKPLVTMLLDAGCEVRGDDAMRKADARVKPASEEDWSTEYLDSIISARVVDGVDDAIAHIERYGSHHTDSIVTDDKAAAEKFLREVDSAIVLHNASTQFADGGEFGFGAEIGIATGRFHARGPVGAEQLTSFNYRVRGSGQTRP